MKKKLLCTLFFMLITILANGQRTVSATYYHPVKGQGVGNSLITADGSRIHLGKLKSGNLRWIAVSRDLLRSGFEMGDTVVIDCEDPFFRGIWIIKDKMGKRMKNKIDFLLHPSSPHKPPRKVKIRKSSE